MSEESKSYWKSSIRIVLSLLSVWAFISYGCGILFRDTLDQFKIGNAPFGFWMAQQGAIIGFLIILVTYSILMNRLDKTHGYDEEDDK